MEGRCGAKARTRGSRPCQARPVRGKARCRLHGGLSTGPRTPEGLERSRRARWKHGRFSKAAIEERRRANWETRETAPERFRREERRRERVTGRQVRRLSREIERLFEQLPD